MNDDELLIRVRADIKEALAGLATIQRQISAGGAVAERSARGVNTLARGYQFLQRTAGAYLALRIAANIVRTADAYQVLVTRIRTASRSLGDHVAIQRALESITRRNGTALADTVGLFQRLSQAAPELGATAEEVLRLTDAVQQIGIIGGSNPTQMSNALLQFGQMLTGGVARAEELNSLLENMPELALRLARGMKMTDGELIRAVKSGKVLSQDVFRAVLSQAEDVSREVRHMPDTVGRAGQAFSDSWAKALGTLDALIGGTSKLAGLLRTFSGWMESFSDRFSRDVDFTPSRQSEERIAELRKNVAAARSEIKSLGSGFSFRSRSDIEADQAVLRAQIGSMERAIEFYERLAASQREQEAAAAKAAAEQNRADAPISDEEKKRLDSIEKIIAALEDEAATLSLTEKEIARYRLAQLGATQADMERAEMAVDMAAEQQRVRSIDELISSLQEEAATTGMTAEQIAVYRLSLLGASEAEIALAREAAATAAAIKESQETMRAGAAIIDQTRTAQEKFNARIAEAVRLYEAGAFGAVGSADAIETLRREAVAAQTDLAELGKTGAGVMDELTAAARGWGDSFTDTLADMVLSGKASFSDLAQAIIRDLIRIAAYMQIVRPILQHFGMIDTPAAAPAPTGMAAGGAVRGPGGPTSDSVPIMASNGEFVMRAAAVRHYGEGFLAQLNALRAPRFAHGGLVRIASLPRFAEGGLVSAGAGGGGGAVQVSIDNRGAPKSVRSAQASVEPDQVIVTIVLDDLDRNGPISQRMASTYGLRR